jgi:pimeloyl-ACP methyl ester carboxylesterase
LGRRSHWAKVILELKSLGYEDIRAVENPLTSLADDAERTRKMIAQVGGPVVLVGHSYGGAVISEAGNHPNVAALVFVAAFAPDKGESPGGITQKHLPVAAPNLVPDSDGYLWLKPDKFHESFARIFRQTMGSSWRQPRRHLWQAPLEIPSASLPGNTSLAGIRCLARTT